MSQAENLEGAGIGDGESALSGTFTLQVVSPSAGVTGPISFPQLPTGTTVKQVKEKIRESLPMRPADDQQRLIHRGRLLARDDETMSEIFGQETNKTSQSQTLHLVLKPSASEMSSAQNTANVPPQQAVPPVPSYFLPPPPQHPAFQRMLAERRQQIANRPPPTNTEPAVQTTTPIPPNFHSLPPPTPPEMANQHAGLNHHMHPHNPAQPQEYEIAIDRALRTAEQFQRDHQLLHQESLNHRQHPVPTMPGAAPQNLAQAQPTMPSFQNLVAQHQRDRAASGMHSAQQSLLRQGSNTISSIGRSGFTTIQPNRLQLPQQTRTSSHEVYGPDGHRWTVTVNETVTYYPTPNGAPHQVRTTPEASTTRDVQDMVQNIVRAVDGNVNAVQSLPDQHRLNSQSIPDSSASTDEATNNPASATPPDTSTQSPPSGNSVRASSEQLVPIDGPSNTPSINSPTVYILSSPTGPRGLLVAGSENGLEAFYTPRRQVHWETARQIQQPHNPIQAQNDAALGLPEVRNRREGRHGHGHHHGHRHAGAAARAAPGVAHRGNPPAGVVAAQMWPHIWLVLRLLGFVWFFTSGSDSWWRLFMFSIVALIIFVASTGILNGVFEQVWGPIRRHLENLLPLAAPHAQQAIPPDQPAVVAAPAQGQAGGVEGGAPGAAVIQPDPAQTAARLLEQQRAANENWLWTQFRRLEHATILFVASLVPGVGERHIAARVAEENLLLEAQRQRRAADAAAAEELSRTAEGRQENGGVVPPTGTDTDTMGVDTPTTDLEDGDASLQQRSENANGDGAAGAGDAPAQPLIEM